ncbi:hypothetical protein SEA_MADI_78 [Gordonia phage Madi]|uniref:Uncharacterized protein n=1 Tax=Gordonia phage Sienna TaxID=2759396 RepID=A0A7L7SQH2_9CAUD|nr:hypothetical protein SEA_SIENNA_79 [Gordonia phage Sienna]QYW00881.1 hypothetical protein SEA_MADI_78 [Gordonia phage Madi]
MTEHLLPHDVLTFQEAVDAGHDEWMIKSWARGAADQISIDLMVSNKTVSEIVQAAVVVYDYYVNHVMSVAPMGLLYPSNQEVKKVYQDFLDEQQRRYDARVAEIREAEDRPLNEKDERE